MNTKKKRKKAPKKKKFCGEGVWYSTNDPRRYCKNHGECDRCNEDRQFAHRRQKAQAS